MHELFTMPTLAATLVLVVSLLVWWLIIERVFRPQKEAAGKNKIQVSAVSRSGESKPDTSTYPVSEKPIIKTTTNSSKHVDALKSRSESGSSTASCTERVLKSKKGAGNTTGATPQSDISSKEPSATIDKTQGLPGVLRKSDIGTNGTNTTGPSSVKKEIKGSINSQATTASKDDQSSDVKNTKSLPKPRLKMKTGLRSTGSANTTSDNIQKPGPESNQPLASDTKAKPTAVELINPKNLVSPLPSTHKTTHSQPQRRAPGTTSAKKQSTNTKKTSQTVTAKNRGKPSSKGTVSSDISDKPVTLQNIPASSLSPVAELITPAVLESLKATASDENLDEQISIRASHNPTHTTEPVETTPSDNSTTRGSCPPHSTAKIKQPSVNATAGQPDDTSKQLVPRVAAPIAHIATEKQPIESSVNERKSTKDQNAPSEIPPSTRSAKTDNTTKHTKPAKYQTAAKVQSPSVRNEALIQVQPPTTNAKTKSLNQRLDSETADSGHGKANQPKISTLKKIKVDRDLHQPSLQTALQSDSKQGNLSKNNVAPISSAPSRKQSRDSTATPDQGKDKFNNAITGKSTIEMAMAKQSDDLEDDADGNLENQQTNQSNVELRARLVASERKVASLQTTLSHIQHGISDTAQTPADTSPAKKAGTRPTLLSKVRLLDQAKS